MLNPVEQERVDMMFKIKDYLKITDWSKVGWKAIYEAQEALGYPLNNDQKRMLGR
jgi:hypothetical protein